MSHPCQFDVELKQLINKYSIENESDTPDYMLADYLLDCLAAWNKATVQRDLWYKRGNDEPKSV